MPTPNQKLPHHNNPIPATTKKKHTHTHKHLQQRGKQKGNTGRATTPSHHHLQHPFSLIAASTSKTACTQLQPNDKQEEVPKHLPENHKLCSLLT
jgi:hypothetical protein